MHKLHKTYQPDYTSYKKLEGVLLIKEIIIYLGLFGPIAFFWNVITWWIGRNPLPVVGLECKRHRSLIKTPIYEIFMTVTNKGHRPLELSQARIMILKGIPSEKSARVEFLDPFDITEEYVDQLKKEGSLVVFESLPQMTKEIGVFIDPEDSESEVIAFNNPPEGVYKVVFTVTVERLHFLTRWRPKKLPKLYSEVHLLVVTY